LRPSAIELRGDGEGPGVALHAQAFFDVEGRAAAVLVADLLLVDLAQRRLDEGRTRAQEGHGPHPEYGARATERDGGGHTRDIAGADAAGQRHGQRLERRHTLLRALPFSHQAQHLADVPHLQEAAADREVQARPEAQGDHDGAPDDTVDCVDQVEHGGATPALRGSGRAAYRRRDVAQVT
jgi:hypothetical protein